MVKKNKSTLNIAELTQQAQPVDNFPGTPVIETGLPPTRARINSKFGPMVEMARKLKDEEFIRVPAGSMAPERLVAGLRTALKRAGMAHRVRLLEGGDAAVFLRGPVRKDAK